MINPIGLVFFVLLRSAALSKIDPESLCCPFDRKRSGLVQGEGAGMVVLEEESHALSRGARIYGEVAGYASTMDAWRLTAPHPEGQGAEGAMSRALEDSGIAPEGIDYINAHGTSTPYNDRTETQAIKTCFGDHAYNVAISSTKSMIGHTLGAAGAVEAVISIMSILTGIMPPTINLHHPDPECDLDYIPNVARHGEVNVALSNAMGFGGHNTSLIFKRYEE